MLIIGAINRTKLRKSQPSAKHESEVFRSNQSKNANRRKAAQVHQRIAEIDGHEQV